MINPLAYMEKVVRSFLRYQSTTYPFADRRLNDQMRRLLSLDETRNTPLLKGPYISLSRAFAPGAPVARLVRDGILHPHMERLVNFPTVYGHQEAAIRAIHAGQTTLISTGTGSGKSECFLYPIISRCLELRDQQAPPGICAVIVYPMNALAEDQLGRLRELLAGTGITFGMYIGKTPENEADVVGPRLDSTASRADFRQAQVELRQSVAGMSAHPFEEVCSREIMRTPGRQPRILLTNVKQLELLLTRQKDIELFDNARLDFLVFDEAHTFTGANGAETACLIRRLRAYCGRAAHQTVCVATSATIFDPEDTASAKTFATRFFGADESTVATVQEIYERELWREDRRIPPAPKDSKAFLDQVRQAIDSQTPASDLTAIFKEFGGTAFKDAGWEATLHDALAGNELLFQAAQLLEKPQALSELCADLSQGVRRAVSEEELIAWLMLGAAACKDGRPIVRPVTHGFIRGVPGAIVTFDDNSDEPILHLSAEDDTPEKKLRLPVATCLTCGQHYFEHWLNDFSFIGTAPDGGIASAGSRYWEPATKEHNGRRLVLVDRLVSAEDDEEPGDKTSPLFFCRVCGAAHVKPESRCHACGAAGRPLKFHVVQQKKDKEDYLARCVCCNASGRLAAGKFREPARRVRAVNVSDVHVLAQDMIQHAERKRLLLFADNRQDAAFQAGWMRDHARRFRLRALIAAELQAGALSLGDLVYRLDRLMEDDDDLSRSLLPELWVVVPTKEAGGNEHRNERKHLLRIHVLMELTTPMRQTIGLEPWGRIRINYIGLDASAPFIQNWARRLKLPDDELLGGVAAFLDQLRRRKILFDSIGNIFSRKWDNGDRDIQNGFLPLLEGIPKGVKFTRDPSDRQNWVTQWLSPGHQPTTASQIAGKWGVIPEEIPVFLRELWDWLRADGVELLVPTIFKGSRGRALPGCPGTHQVNSDRLMIISTASGSYRCAICRQQSVRRTPEMKCLAWRCAGILEHVPENPDNYDLQLLDGHYDMLRPREHTAMVPAAERENLEHIFKGESDAVNTLVCTQTLELGVDIGALDAILMRNVPPKCANYWQRAGRAGRRHRMAVDLTYCRLVSHDRAYFNDPVKMLGGRIDPPGFNLSNELMVRKHVHATVLTALQALARASGGLDENSRMEIARTLKQCFPILIADYLFSTGQVRAVPEDVGVLRGLIAKYQPYVERQVRDAFAQGWPASDAAVVATARLNEYILNMPAELELVIKRLHRRLRWAMTQMEQLENIRRRHGDLDEEQKSFYDRCHRYIRKIKHAKKRGYDHAEGIDDIITLSVLAAEGFLPGYGLETGSIIGMAETPKWVRGLSDFNLPRPPAVAIREYVPGNLIYANGQRFVPRRYTREAGENQHELIRFAVYPDRQALQEVQGTGIDAAASVITSIPVCDVTLVHQSRISDEEENRFQMGVAIYGRELGQHAGGTAYKWGARELRHLHGVRFQLVNVGAPFVIKSRNEFGYPVCRVCGQSVSPFSSQRQREDFENKHRESCQCEPKNIGFHADLTADAILLPSCSGREEAYSILEGFRFAANHVLDMDMEDLQILVTGQIDGDEVDAYLYDPMPGGSGLLVQICDKFNEIIQTAAEFAKNCPAQCEASCIDCFQTYRNAFYHEHLNRTTLLERLESFGDRLVKEYDIPSKLPTARPAGDAQPVNNAERKLRGMLCKAGLPEGLWQQQFMLAPPLKSTTPDVMFDDPDDPTRKIFIYLDGMSKHIHGNPATAKRDNEIRSQLRADGHEVITITAVELDDMPAMTRYFKKLARQLLGRDAAQHIAVRADDWFKVAASPAQKSEMTASAGVGGLQMIEPDPADMFKTCLPVYDLEIAAGAFSEGQTPEPLGWASIKTGRALNNTMFIAKVMGKSMEPKVPDGAWCLFTTYVAGSRYGRDLAVQHHDISDPETGGSYTLKRYGRPPQALDTGDELKGAIHLIPLNPAFKPIVLNASQQENLRVIGELVEVLGDN